MSSLQQSALGHLCNHESKSHVLNACQARDGGRCRARLGFAKVATFEAWQERQGSLYQWEMQYSLSEPREPARQAPCDCPVVCRVMTAERRRRMMGA